MPEFTAARVTPSMYPQCTIFTAPSSSAILARVGDLQGYSRVDALRSAYMATEHELLGRGDEAFGRLLDPRGSGLLFFMFIRPQPYTCLGIEWLTQGGVVYYFSCL